MLAGACLGWAAACRPSDGALILGAAAGALAVLPRTSRAPLALGAALVVLPTVAGLLLIEPLYLSEAWRFVAGHALLWGKTPFAEPGHGGPGWIAVLAGQPGLALLLAAGGLAALLVLADARRRGPAAAAAATAFLAHAVWTAGFQNPENLRHLAPLLVLGPLLLCLLPGAAARGAALICLAAELAVLIPATRPDPSAPAPLAAAAAVLAGLPPDSAVATNLGVAVLREALPIRVYDSYYAADAALGLARAGGVALRLTATEPATALRVFAPRFLGERGLWLVCARSPCAAGG